MSDFDVLTCREDSAAFARLRDELGAGTSPPKVKADALAPGVTEDTLLASINAARIELRAAVGGPDQAAAVGDVDADLREEDVRFEPLVSLLDFDATTAVKRELEALVAHHRDWRMERETEKKNPTWAPRAAAAADAAVSAQAARGGAPAADASALEEPPTPTVIDTIAEVLRIGRLTILELKAELGRRKLATTGTKAALAEWLLAGAEPELLRICGLKVVELKQELEARGLKISGRKPACMARLHAGEDEANTAVHGAGARIGQKPWLLDRAVEIFVHSAQRGVPLATATAAALDWAKASINSAVEAGTATALFTPAPTVADVVAKVAEHALLEALRVLERKKKVPGDRHGPFYSLALLRQSRLRSKQLDLVVEHVLEAQAAGGAGPPNVGSALDYADRHALLRALLPPSPIENALRALEIGQPILCGTSAHFAGHSSHLIRRANEDFPDWSEEWKLMCVIDGLDIGYILHEIGDDHSRCRSWMPHASCDQGPGFHSPTNAPWSVYESAAYPRGMVHWLSLLLRAWIFGPYMQQRIGEIILYARSSVPESFFHRLRINVSKAHHTTNLGMAVGGAKSQLDHNELKRNKVLSAAIEINKHHKEKGIRAERSAAPAERIWQEDGAMDIFGDIPERVNLAYERLAKAAASKKRRIAYCADIEAELARGKTPKRRCGGPSDRLPDLEPSAPLRLAAKPDGTLYNTCERVRSTATATAVPMHPFSGAAVVIDQGAPATPPLAEGEGPHFRAAVQHMMENNLV